MFKENKISTNNKYAWIGLAGIKDYNLFFSTLEHDQTSIKGETQISNGLNSLLDHNLKIQHFTWFDTGSIENYEATKKILEPKDFFDFSKKNELLFFANDKVIKFFNDKNIVKNRLIRAKNLKGLVPKISNTSGRFYSYDKIPGDIFYHYYSDKLFLRLLQFCKENLFVEKKIISNEKFINSCKEFYIDKTYNRVQDFFAKSNIKDNDGIINSENVLSFDQLFKKLDLKLLCSGKQTVFHGDLQFDNIIYNPDKDEFVFIDWRDSFGKTNRVGDLYYDLGKMYAGICMPYYLIKKNKFNFTLTGNEVVYNFSFPNKLINAKKIFTNFVISNGYSMKKVEILTALIYLNMSGLHNDPLDHLLFFHGKYLLNNLLKGTNN